MSGDTVWVTATGVQGPPSNVYSTAAAVLYRTVRAVTSTSVTVLLHLFTAGIVIRVVVMLLYGDRHKSLSKKIPI